MKAFYPLTLAASLALASMAANAGVSYANTGLGSAGNTVTFEEIVLPDGSALSNQYAALGVTFLNAFYQPQSTTFPPATSGHQIGNFFPVSGLWSIYFNNQMSAAAFGIATNPANTTVEALLNGVVVGSATAATDFDGTDYFQITGLTFNEIRLSTSGDQLALVDNLQFTAAVPEPGTWILLSLGLLGLAAGLRRRY